MREQLISSRESIFYDSDMTRLLAVLKSEFLGFVTACVIQWFPEESEDELTVLVDGATASSCINHTGASRNRSYKY